MKVFAKTLLCCGIQNVYFRAPQKKVSEDRKLNFVCLQDCFLSKYDRNQISFEICGMYSKAYARSCLFYTKLSRSTLHR